MTADSAPHWLQYSEADFDASRAPRGAARKRAAEADQGGLFFLPTPVTRPARQAAAGDQLPGQADIFAVLEGEAS